MGNHVLVNIILKHIRELDLQEPIILPNGYKTTVGELSGLLTYLLDQKRANKA